MNAQLCGNLSTHECKNEAVPRSTFWNGTTKKIFLTILHMKDANKL